MTRASVSYVAQAIPSASCDAPEHAIRLNMPSRGIQMCTQARSKSGDHGADKA